MFPTQASYRAAWETAYTQDPIIPLNLDIELSSACNLRCPFCFIADPNFDNMIREKSEDGRPRQRLMPTEMAISLIDQAAKLGIPALKFNWRGESTLHPDYSKILTYARNKTRGGCNECDGYEAFYDILINSNFDFKPRALEGVLSATKVMVSLDSCNPEIHANMRVGSNFFNVLGNIRQVLQAGHPNVWIRRVVTSLNKHENFKADCNRAFGNFGKFQVSEHMVFDRNVEEKHSPDVHLSAPELERQYCGYPSQRLVITSAGLAIPCCIALMENLIVGDVKKQSLTEIWNGEKLKDLRVVLRNSEKEKMSDACKSCSSWMAYKHPYRELVKDKAL